MPVFMTKGDAPLKIECHKRRDGSAWVVIGDVAEGPHFQCDYLGDVEVGPRSISDFSETPPDWVKDRLALAEITKLKPRKPLDWECQSEDFCYRAAAPLFGSIRVERFSLSRPWQINWSVPGYCDTLLGGDWEDAASAIKAAEEHVTEICQSFAA